MQFNVHFQVLLAVLFFIGKYAAQIEHLQSESKLMDEFGDQTTVLYAGGNMQIACKSTEELHLLGCDFEAEQCIGMNDIPSSRSGSVTTFTLSMDTPYGIYCCQVKSDMKPSDQCIFHKYVLCSDSSDTCRGRENCKDLCIEDISDARCESMDEIKALATMEFWKKLVYCQNGKTTTSLVDMLKTNLSRTFLLRGTTKACPSDASDLYFLMNNQRIPFASVLPISSLRNLKLTCPNTLGFANCTEKLTGGTIIRQFPNFHCDELLQLGVSKQSSIVTKFECFVWHDSSRSIMYSTYVYFANVNPPSITISEGNKPACSAGKLAPNRTLTCSIAWPYYQGFTISSFKLLLNGNPKADFILDTLLQSSITVDEPGIYQCSVKIQYKSCKYQMFVVDQADRVFTGEGLSSTLEITSNCGSPLRTISTTESSTMSQMVLHIFIASTCFFVGVGIIICVGFAVRWYYKKQKISHILGDSPTTTTTTTTDKAFSKRVQGNKIDNIFPRSQSSSTISKGHLKRSVDKKNIITRATSRSISKKI